MSDDPNRPFADENSEDTHENFGSGGIESHEYVDDFIATEDVMPVGSVDVAAAPAAPPTTDTGETARYSHAQLRRARDVLTRLYAVRRAARFYPLEHPAVREGVDALLYSISEYHNEGVDIHFGFFEGEILLGEQLLTEESLLFDQLIRDMTAIGVGSLSIRREVTGEELARFVKLASQDAGEIDEQGGLESLARHLRLDHIDIGEVRTVERYTPPDDVTEEARGSYNGAVSLLREIDRLMRVDRSVSASKVKGVVRSLVDNVLGNRYAMLQLTGLKNYDEYTFYHSANVAILSLALGSLITRDYRFLSSLGVGALLHDVGKLSIELDVLNKPGPLNPDEWEHMRQHPVRGAEMVSQMPGVDRSAVVMILEHHMRFDSTGYPVREPVREQHLASRIVAVCDSYDAMTSRRSYSAARVQDDAMAMLAKSGGTALDPVLVRLFVRMLGVYPPRSVVRLSSGDVAIVLKPSEFDPLRPYIRVVADADGGLIEPREIDLAEDRSLTIRGCIDPQLLNIDVESFV